MIARVVLALVATSAAAIGQTWFHSSVNGHWYSVSTVTSATENGSNAVIRSQAENDWIALTFAPLVTPSGVACFCQSEPACAKLVRIGTSAVGSTALGDCSPPTVWNSGEAMTYTNWGPIGWCWFVGCVAPEVKHGAMLLSGANAGKWGVACSACYALPITPYWVLRELVSPDCNLNGVPDAVEADCDHDGVMDQCAIAAGTVADFNLNGVPDSCDIASGVLHDCNANGLPDTQDIAMGTVLDCNGNSVPDGCDLASGVPDCNANGVLDSCDIAAAQAQDCNGDGVPDSCQIGVAHLPFDCDANGAVDSCEIASNPAKDLNLNGRLDVCERIGTPFCFGDATGAACPCGNTGVFGAGCMNSGGGSGRLQAFGTARVSQDRVVLHVSSLGAAAPVLFFQGNGLDLVGGTTGLQFGDGLRCVFGQIIRLPPVKFCTGGITWLGPGVSGDTPISILGAPVMPNVRYYQAWYRDAVTFCTPAFYSMSNAIQLAWQP